MLCTFVLWSEMDDEVKREYEFLTIEATWEKWDEAATARGADGNNARILMDEEGQVVARWESK